MALKNHIPFGPAPIGEPLLVHKTGEGASVVVRDNEPWTLWFTRLTTQTNDLIFDCCAQADRWTPEHTNKVNISASAPRLSQYSLTGNFVTFSGEFDVTPTLPGIVTSFEMSIPVESSFGATGDAGGTAGAKEVAGQVAAIFANTTNGTLQVQWVAGDTSSRTMNFSGSYWITNAAPPPYPPLHITTPCPTDEPVLDEAYSYQFEATGGKKPYHWTAVGLPNGMTINEFTGILSGTPTESGTFSYTITVADSQTPTPFTDSLDCEFVIAGDTCVATEQDFDFIDSLGVDDDYIYVADQEEPARLNRILRNTDVVADTITLPFDECDFVISDATYVYVGGYNYSDGEQHICRILKSDFTTIDDLVTTTTARFAFQQVVIDSGFLYCMPTKNSGGFSYGTGGLPGAILRLTLSDFSTVVIGTFNDANPTWDKSVFSFVFDSTDIYISARLGGAATEPIEIFKMDKASFTQTADLLITDSGVGNAGTLAQDATDIYLNFTPIAPVLNPGIVKIQKATFTQTAIEFYPFGAGVFFNWLVLDGAYLYALTNEFPARLFRITKSALSTYDIESLVSDSGSILVVRDSEFFITTLNSNPRLIHLCEFTPD